MQQYTDKAVELLIQYIPNVLLAILVLIVGLKLIKVLAKGMDKAMARKDLDKSLRHFLSSMVTIILKVVLFISIASMLGIATTSFIALLGAAGLAVGLALQGSLANFAGGVLILFFKPYSVGEFISAQGFMGTVKEIQVFNTVLNTPDNKVVIIPNGPMSNGPITNFSREETRRVDLVFGIGYDDDIKKAQDVLLDIISDHKKILGDPAPLVRVGELADSSVNFNTRVWVKSEDYWDVFYDLQETVKQRFDKEGISIPYPQRDMHMIGS